MRLPQDMRRNMPPPRTSLTEEDLDVIRRFVTAIKDPGIELVLTLVVLGEIEVEADIKGMVKEGIRQVVVASRAGVDERIRPEGIVDAYPAFSFFVAILRDADLFPADFLPSSEVLAYLESQYFEMLRARATTP